jgi:hypothetical protein
MHLKIGEKSVFECIIPIKINVQNFLQRFGGTALARARAREHINPHCFFVEFTKMVFAVVVPCACFVLLGTVSPALPVESPALFFL